MTAVPYFCCLGISKNVDFFFSQSCFEASTWVFSVLPTGVLHWIRQVRGVSAPTYACYLSKAELIHLKENIKQ